MTQLFYKLDDIYKPITFKDLFKHSSFSKTKNITFKKHPRQFFFIRKKSISLICNKYDKKNYIPFEWDYVRLFASTKQKIMFNNFRKNYIKKIIINTCLENVCELKIIGSDPTTAASDADFDIYGEDVDQIIEKINKTHHIYFKESMDLIFDINIYGTIADIFVGMNCVITGCVNHIKNIDRQHQWAFIRIAEYFPDKLVNSLSEYDQKLYNVCIKQIQLLGKHPDQKKYIIHLKKYLNMDEIDYDKLADIFAKTKFYEQETYRSVGAVLNIVKKMENLPKDMMKDSVYDNFGFIVEILFKKHECPLSMNDNIMKISKYINRICNAQLIIGKIDLNDLKLHTEYLNIKRKKMENMTPNDLQKFKDLLNINIITDAKTFVIAIYNTCVNI